MSNQERRVVGARGLRVRAPEDNRKFLALGPLLTGMVPMHPPQVDYLAALHGGWEMLGNGPGPDNANYGFPEDGAGDCVAVCWANDRRLVTTTLGEAPHYPGLTQVKQLYMTQNPGFPKQDDGMDIQACLDHLRKAGGPDGAKLVAFAKVNQHDEEEVNAALAIFGQLWAGITVSSGNEDQFSAGQAWDFIAGDDDIGGHGVLVGGYGGIGQGPLAGDKKFITWGAETSFTDDFWGANRVGELWAAIWPEHLGSHAFLHGVDRAILAAAFKAITGQNLPLPPAPKPTPPPAGWQAKQAACDELNGVLGPWLRHHHTAGNATAAAAAMRWQQAMGYDTTGEV